MFRSLGVRNYRLFAGGQLVKLIGTWAQFIAQDWLVLQLSNNSGTALGVVTALQFTPVLLLTLYGGRLADRYDKRRLLMVANGAFSVLSLVLGVLVATGLATLDVVFAFALGMGVATAVENPARQAFASELVGYDMLPNALALSSATFNAARIVGPAIAGVAIGWFGVGPVFLGNALWCAAPLVALWRMRPDELFREAALASGPARIADGLRYVRRRLDLLLPIVLVLVIGTFGFNFQLTLAVLAKNEFHAGAGSFGLLTTALAVGALAAALASSGRRGRPSIYVVLASAFLFGLLEMVVGFAPGFLSAAVLLLPTGFFMIYFAQSANQRVQLGTDAAYRGRVMALYVLVFLGTTPIGAPLVGWCSEHLGPRPAIWIGGLATLLCAVAVTAAQVRISHARVRLHLRPTPHVQIREPAAADRPAMEVRVPAVPAGSVVRS
jgi:MFS family permease